MNDENGDCDMVSCAAVPSATALACEAVESQRKSVN